MKISTIAGTSLAKVVAANKNVGGAAKRFFHNAIRAEGLDIAISPHQLDAATSARFYAITHVGDERTGLMAWLSDGRTLQYLAETGMFHDNPSLGDDLTFEQYNEYSEINSSAASGLLSSVEPLDPRSLGWLVARFAQQSQRDRVSPANLGLMVPKHAQRAVDSTTAMMAEFSGPTEGPSVEHRLQPISWLSELSTLDNDSPGCVRSTVAELLLKAFAAEASITGDLLDCLTGQTLLGLEHRVKSPPSLARKVDMWFAARTPTAASLQPHNVVSSIPDVVRYTMVTQDHDQMVRDAQDVAIRLAEKGHRLVSTEHSYLKGNFYKGFKSVWEAPMGQRWEMQFRSSLNLEFKDRAYPLYKASRDIARSVAERKASLAQTTEIYSALPTPAGLTDDAKLAGKAVRARIYASPFAEGSKG
ncbi:MAG: hypothetical protein ABW137_19470 [Mycobacterium sp.]